MIKLSMFPRHVFLFFFCPAIFLTDQTEQRFTAGNAVSCGNNYQRQYLPANQTAACPCFPLFMKNFFPVTWV